VLVYDFTALPTDYGRKPLQALQNHPIQTGDVYEGEHTLFPSYFINLPSNQV
jgi:hypothetical protein